MIVVVCIETKNTITYINFILFFMLVTQILFYKAKGECKRVMKFECSIGGGMSTMKNTGICLKSNMNLYYTSKQISW